MCNMKEKFPKLLTDINPLIGRPTNQSGHNFKNFVYIMIKLQIDGQTETKQKPGGRKEKRMTI